MVALRFALIGENGAELAASSIDGGKVTVRRMRGDDKPIAGTQLIREYQGVEHRVGGEGVEGMGVDGHGALSRGPAPGHAGHP